MTDPHDRAVEAAATTGTQTHHEPHGGAAPHGATDDVGDHEHESHDDAALGPVDVEAWLAAALGVVLGLIVAVCLVIAVWA